MQTLALWLARRMAILLIAAASALSPAIAFASETAKVLGQLAPAASSATVTISNASPGVVSWSGSNLAANDQVVFTTTGSLPTGLTAGTPYFVISAGLGANSFEVSASQGGSAINTSSAGSGTHTGKSYRQLYAVPSSTSTVISTITATNQSATADTIRIAVQPAAAALATKHFIAYDLPISGNDTQVLTLGITLAQTDIVTVYTTNGTTSFSAFGVEVQ